MAQKRSKLARCSGVKDRLSSLPDEILINNILSLLPTREAQRTSILARSWRYLWSYVPCLDLDASPEVVSNHPTKNYSALQNLDYAKWVDGVIAAYRGTTALRHFRVLSRLDRSLACSIASWLAFSLRQGVEVLELDCCCDASMRDPVIVFLPVRPSWYPNVRLLRSLTLKGVGLASGYLEGLLLACCESLEKLQLAEVSCLKRVRVRGRPVSRLKHIHIDSCHELESITISDPTPDLVSFTYPVRSSKKRQITMHVEHAPRLVDLRMVLPCRAYQHITLHPLFCYLSQLEALHLVHSSPAMNTDPWHDFPVLSCLKHLKSDFAGPKLVRQKLRCLASVIEKAPSLQHLTLEVCGDGQPRKLLKELANMNLQLPPLVAVIEITGFRGRMAYCELASHLIDAAPSLEKLILDRRDPSRRGCVLGPYECSEKTVKSWEKVVEDVIEPEQPSNAKLVLI